MEKKNNGKVSGVYCIINILDNKKYIGSSKNIYSRWFKHKANLRGNYHPNSYLQNAWNKYGEENFHFIILKKCPEECLLETEQSYIDNLKPEYNIMLEAKRTTVTEVIREHISEGVRKAISEGRMPLNPMIGKKMSPEHLAKLPQNQKGYKCPKRQKGVYVYDLDMNLVSKYNTLKEAGDFIGVAFQVISYAVLKSKSHKCKNYYVFREEQNRQEGNTEGNS